MDRLGVNDFVNAKSQDIQAEAPDVLALDGHSLLYRAYFALPDTIRDPSGRAVNAIHGFISMLSRLLRENRPSEVLIAYDSPWPTLRHSIFPAYKGNRAALPPALLDQVPLLQTLLRRTGVPTLAISGYEGDDILASLAESCVTRRTRLLLVTGDRDLFQLVRDPWVRVLYTKRGVNKTQVLDESGVEQLVGVPASRYADLAALRGDPADNIPGVPGIGTKGSLTIIRHLNSLEDIFRYPERVPEYLRNKLITGWNQLLQNRQLIRPISGVPANWDAECLSLQIDESEAKRAFHELNLMKACEFLLSASSGLKRSALGYASVSSAERNELLRCSHRISLISCSAEKVHAETAAEDFYASSLFRKSRKWAEVVGGPWYILSAKYGLVSPHTPLSPYDTSLKAFSRDERDRWGDRVTSELTAATPSSALIFLLAGATYSAAVAKRLVNAGYRVAQPLEGMSIGKRLCWLNAATRVGRASADLEDFYEILMRLAADTGGLQSLAEADQRRWPERGVYFFFEPGEHRFCSHRPRVIRVGTHGVSANSKATLWNRLRTHRGIAEGGGNHRSSIFRSHVGAAIMERDSCRGQFPHWGDQSAATADNRSVESELERLVSVTISKMQIVCLGVPDDSSPRSDRAYIERNSIALLSKVGSQLDPSSRNWLGRSSPHPSIRESGLWNVDYVDEPSWDPAFLSVLDYYARATAGKARPVNGSVAPAEWWTRTRARDQMQFDWTEDEYAAGRG